jgi:protein-L-isoaspartate(D-aspartate) O-methyltransferase
VLAAIAAVPRDRFVPADLRHRAWDNEPLPIGSGQTISQPLVVAQMCELLQLDGSERVLDVGTGSGYHAAVLAQLARAVFTIEVRPELEPVRVPGVEYRVGDGLAGWPETAPFGAICVAAAAPEARLATLLGQLDAGGRLVAPVGDDHQVLARYARAGVDFERTDHGRVRFVPVV